MPTTSSAADVTQRIKPIHVVMICLLGATVGGVCLLTSGPMARMEGSKDWSQESPLRAIVSVLNLSYTQTTALGVEIKTFMFGAGAALAVIAGGIALMFRPQLVEEVAGDEAPKRERTSKRQISTTAAAQILMALYLLWSFASVQWSTAPDFALGGSVLLAFAVIWALALGRGLNRRGATVGAGVLLGVGVVTALLAIAYYGERNPTRRASYPVGNPLFLAACLVPSILIALAWGWHSVRSAAKRPMAMLGASGCVLAAGVMLYTVWLTSSRSAAIAIAFGIGVMVVLAVPRRVRLPALLGFVLLIVGGMVYVWPKFTAPSATGRDASLRVRQYAWWYAIDLIEEAKWIGHGQGGYVQFGDAGAINDVLADPQALEARIAHAHNEWLEVATDLGAVGITLAAGALFLTFVGGARATRSESRDLSHWTVIALTASLAALALEECADVALRIAGLPAVFFTVVGLIWATTRRASHERSMPLLQTTWPRRAIGICALVLGGGLLWSANADFRSSRAYYELSDALQRREFDKAERLARVSARYRLSPQRRLEALERKCSTELFIAREHQTSAVERRAKAQTVDPPDPTLTGLAAQAREQSETYINRAKDTFDGLVRRCPAYLGAGWLEYRLFQLRVVFAQWDGDANLTAGLVTGATLALERELRRRPYDPMIALSFVSVAVERLSLAERLDVLARPLRHHAIGPDYTEFISHLTSSAPSFDAEFQPIWNRIIATDAVDGSVDPFAPEKLRIAALIRFMRTEYDLALDTIRMAHRAYEPLVAGGLIGAASAYAEAADYQFFADPTKWQLAMEHVDRAIELLPDSTPGRDMARGLRERRIELLLAGGLEDDARGALSELHTGAGAEWLASEIGLEYAMLCRNLIQRGGGFPTQFEQWVTRAMELRPRDELVWRLKSQLEFDRGDLPASVTSLRQALSLGADPNIIYAFVQVALRIHPGQSDFATLQQELGAALGDPNISSSAPTAPLSPATDPQVGP